MKLHILLALASIATASALGAQAAPPRTPRVAGIAPAPVADTAKRNDRRDGEHHERDGRGAREGDRRPAVQVLQDGRVFADFGRGYEQVVRQCGAPVTAGVPTVPVGVPTGGGVTQPRVAQPAAVQPVAGATQPVPYTPSVAASGTATPQAIQGQSVNASTSCWSVDQQGQVFIAHP